MATNSGIEWTDATWNCLAGCEAVSPGCAKCYAATMTRRLEAMGQADYTGLTTAKHFNGKVRCLPHKLDVPLKWRKPRRVFVNSMSDLFHEDVPDEFIDKVFAVMAMCHQHTFQVLTKRAERMHAYAANWNCAARVWRAAIPLGHSAARGHGEPWPLPNVWLGVSAERQQEAGERIPFLLETPAAVLFVSAEPLLGPIDFSAFRSHPLVPRAIPLDWIIVGGESGHGARPCNVEWIRSIVRQCQAAGVACFVKQLGAFPVTGEPCQPPNRQPFYTVNDRVKVADKKGGDIEEFPTDLRVRQMPELSNA